MAKTSISVPAIKYAQGKNVLYSFVIDAKQLGSIARVTWIHEEEDGKIVGFQRPEIAGHIKNIKGYLEGDPDPTIPNSLILGMVKKPKFTVIDGDLGLLTITGQNALVVDGQQRAAAIRDCSLPEFKMNVVAFVAEDEAKLNETFVRVNSSKPLTTAFLRTLAGTFEGSINPKQDKERKALLLVDRLNRDADSPFKGRIKTVVHPDGFIAQTTVLKMVQESLDNGYLWELKADEDDERMLGVLKRFWEAVSDVFTDAWDLPPADSRLTHAVGIRSLGHIMDQISDIEEEPEKLTKKMFVGWLKKLQPLCHWTEGNWDFGPEGTRPWNRLENTEIGIKLLRNYLNKEYRKMLKKGGGEDAAATAEVA